MGDEEIMQATGAGQADLIGGIQHGCRVAQQLAGMVDGQGLEEGLGAQARPAGEEPLEMGGAEACSAPQGLQRGLLAPVFARGKSRLLPDQLIVAGGGLRVDVDASFMVAKLGAAAHRRPPEFLIRYAGWPGPA